MISHSAIRQDAPVQSQTYRNGMDQHRHDYFHSYSTLNHNPTPPYSSNEGHQLSSTAYYPPPKAEPIKIQSQVHPNHSNSHPPVVSFSHPKNNPEVLHTEPIKNGTVKFSHPESTNTPIPPSIPSIAPSSLHVGANHTAKPQFAHHALPPPPAPSQIHF